MKTGVKLVAAVALTIIYFAVLFAVARPHVSSVYKAYYIDHTTLEWQPPHYPSSPQQGIVFSRKGLPEWVEFTRGLSWNDEWGRWTDEKLGNVAGLKFNQSFDGPLCVTFTARAIPWVVGSTVAVRMGGEAKVLRVNSYDLTKYQVQFTDLKGADEFDLVLPPKLPVAHEVDPRSPDFRRLGLNVATLHLDPGECPVASASSVSNDHH